MKAIHAIRDFFGKYVPRPVTVIFIIFLISVVFHIAASLNTQFANWFNSTVCASLRVALAYTTGWIPFSLGETIVILSPLVLVVLIIASIYACATFRRAMRFTSALLAVVMLVYSAFVLTLGCGYKTDTLDVRMGLDDHEVSAVELRDTALWLIEEANACSLEIMYGTSGASVMPYSFSDMNEKLCDAYDKVAEKYSFVQSFDSNIKPVMLSDAMAYTHITGVYSFFTGEANVNMVFPSYSLVFTSAHEMAHQRGFARENEANFIAFLVCSSSDDVYIRYSAYVNMYEYVMSALYGANAGYYYYVAARVGAGMRGELAAYGAFFEKYRESVASNVSGAINNSYLILQGTEGTRSYGLVVDLAVAYYYSEEKGN